MTIEGARLVVLNGMQKGSVCGEVGVFKGEFSEAILSVVKPSRLHLIDPWKYEESDLYDASWYGGAIGKDQNNMDSVYDSVQNKFSDQIDAGVVSLHRAPSDQVGATFEDDYFDWVYIDGNHQYEYVKKDLEIYTTKVKTGGFIACDDYGVEGWWDDGVLKAVHEYLANHKCRVVYMAESQFIIQKLG